MLLVTPNAALFTDPVPAQPQAPVEVHPVHPPDTCPSASPTPSPSPQLPPVSRYKLKLAAIPRRPLMVSDAEVAKKWAGRGPRLKWSRARAAPFAPPMPTHISCDLP